MDSVKSYIKPCAKCRESNLVIKVITTPIKKAQFYEVVCPKCGETSVMSNVIEYCIDEWNEQEDE